MGGYVMSIKDCKRVNTSEQNDEVIDIFNEDSTEANVAGVVNYGFNNHGAGNLDKTIDVIAKENKELKLKLKELEKQLTEKDSKNRELNCSNTNSIKELTKKLHSRNIECTNLEASNAELKKSLEVSIAEIENLKQSLYKKENDYNDLCSDICTKNSSYSALQCERNMLKEKIEQDNIDYEDLKKAYKDALANIENLKELNKNLSEDKNVTTSTLTHYEIEIDDFDKKYKVAEEYIKYLISCISERDANLENWVGEFGNSPKFKVGKPKGTADKARKYREEGLSIIQVTEKLNKELNNIGYSISRSMVQRYINGEDEGLPLDLTFKFPEIKKLEDMLREKSMDIIEQSNLQEKASEMLEKL